MTKIFFKKFPRLDFCILNRFFFQFTGLVKPRVYKAKSNLDPTPQKNWFNPPPIAYPNLNQK